MGWFALTDTLPKTIRKKTSIWVDEYEWDRFVKNCKKTPWSTCHFLEPYIRTVSEGLEGLNNRPILPTSNITFNMDLNVQRVVRRRKKLGEPEEKIIWRGDPDTCCECGGTPFYVGGYRADSFTSVKKYLCVDCFRFCSGNNELEYWDRLKVSPYYFEGKESRVVKPEIVKVGSGIHLMVDVKDFKDWIGIRVL